jgi:ABC-type antimicrobial peptide transport system permease subunit
MLPRGMIPVVTGLALSSLAATFVTRVFSKMLFGVKPDAPGTFIAIAVAFLTVALVGCFIPARRAAKVDPLIAMRTE